jgi:hypothetical protein
MWLGKLLKRLTPSERNKKVSNPQGLMSNKRQVEFHSRKILLILYEKFSEIVMMIMTIVFEFFVTKMSKQQ